ncbi:helix-turn-helix domain-containing protein [Amycolatopsis dongchuanensis]|uniref:Helix-turn-helix domain-containing protein n=1 Tax=Amycolatopsis dongchuanensis TaxID=1070866 RepID=A0ABP8VLW2_9PSEU
MTTNDRPSAGIGRRATDIATSLASPLVAERARSDAQGADGGIRPLTDQRAADPAPVVFTPAQAAELLQVRESWLRRRAARRQVPCTFLGKHLRFSRANLEQIVADAALPAANAQRRTPGTGASRRPRSRSSSRPR